MELAGELRKPIDRKFNKRKIHSPFINNIWGSDLADMELISKLNKGFRFSLCVIDIYSKYAWVILWKDKQGTTIMNDFQKIFKKSNRKPNKIWVHKGSKFYNRSRLEKKDIETYSTNIVGKSVIYEKFI